MESKKNHGLVMGWDPDCDIVLNEEKGISRYHAALNFNKEKRLTVRDVDDSYGTRPSMMKRAQWAVLA